jgi:hypothetical protein
MQVKQKNIKLFEQLKLKLKALESVQGKVGWFSSSKYQDSTPVAYVAALNEYGHDSTPPRPTVRPAVIEHQKEWNQIALQGTKDILKDKATPHDVMTKVVTAAEEDIAHNLAKITEPKLSPITLVARKYKSQGKEINGTVIGEIAALIKSGHMPDVSRISTKPLNDTELEITTLTSQVENAS